VKDLQRRRQVNTTLFRGEGGAIRCQRKVTGRNEKKDGIPSLLGVWAVRRARRQTEQKRESGA